MTFINNKYNKLYFRIIESAKNNSPEIYEKHHIIPKSLGGNDEPDNIVKLTLRQHYICHKLLTKMTEGDNLYKMMWALHRMCFSGKYGSTSRLYEKFRINFVHNLKINHSSLHDKNYSKRMSEQVYKSWEENCERRKKQSEYMKKKWTDGKITAEQSRINGHHGLKGKDIHNTLSIEYKGDVYYGWQELKEKTGVSKHLYKKYYMKGMDPEFRINTNGPNPKNSTTTNLKGGV